MANSHEFDLVIIGGGLAGLSLGVQLLRQNPKIPIAIFEKAKSPPADATHKVGESTVELGAHYLSHTLGMETHLKTSQLPKSGLRFFFPAKGNSDIAKRVECGGSFMPRTPSYQIDRGLFERELRKKFTSLGGKYFDDCTVKAITMGETIPHITQVDRNGESQCFSSRWLVDASGRRGFLRHQLGLGKIHPYSRHAAWLRVDRKIDIDSWSTEDSWQTRIPGELRWLGTNHLMGNGYWAWIIPLQNNRTSIGLVAADTCHPPAGFNSLARLKKWFQKQEPQLARELDNEKEILDYQFLANYSHHCSQLFSSQRWALTGEAGFFLDPFYSPGTDFIAIGNRFISLLVQKEGAHDFPKTVKLFNRISQQLFDSFDLLYAHQYQRMGDPSVMLPKLMWDFSVYWGIICLAFMHETPWQNIKTATETLVSLDTLQAMNHDVQTAFRKAPLKQNNSYSGPDYLDPLSLHWAQHFNNNLFDNFQSPIDPRILSKNIQTLKKIARGTIEIVNNGRTQDLHQVYHHS